MPPIFEREIIPGADALTQKTIWVIEKRKKKKAFKLLLSRPSHEVQARKAEIQEIEGLFEELRKRHADSVVSIFLLGAPACGKTQLARQCGEWYYDRQLANQEVSLDKKITIVGTLDVRNESSLWRSYSRLATDLHCEVRADGQLKDRLSVLKAMVQKRFQENPGWLLIVDGVNEQSKSAI